MKKLISIIALMGVTACDAHERRVPGWEHGVILCKAECIIINLGHENDPQVAELLKLGTTCNKE